MLCFVIYFFYDPLCFTPYLSFGPWNANTLRQEVWGSDSVVSDFFFFYILSKGRQRFTGPWNERELPQKAHNKSEGYSKVVLVSCRNTVERRPHAPTPWRWNLTVSLCLSFPCSHTPGLLVLSLSFLICPCTPTSLFSVFLPLSRHQSQIRGSVDVPSLSPPHAMFINMADRELSASASLTLWWHEY